MGLLVPIFLRRYVYTTIVAFIYNPNTNEIENKYVEELWFHPREEPPLKDKNFNVTVSNYSKYFPIYFK